MAHRGHGSKAASPRPPAAGGTSAQRCATRGAAVGHHERMRKLLLLPITVPLAAVRGALEAAARTVAEALEHDEEPWEAPPPAATTQVPAPPPAPARPAPEPGPPVPDEPSPAEVGRLRMEQREEESGPGSVGAEVHVDEPWEGYARMTASQVVGRLTGADAATKAVVRLYESSHRNRKTVLRATET
jgi:hypothetical protein